MSKLRFDDKVAIVTGAGNGLGRSHALLLASRGAKVVVNDLGGTFSGDGESTKAADTVVEEIRAAGGEAIPNYNSVVDGEQIVRTALDEWGRVDILINNAGILRDTSFQKMSPEDWDLIYQVHVLGSFKVTHAAWPIMREQNFGRIIMTASAAGIYGNFGQANYSMAKLGLLGFSNTLAIEGRKRNIYCNTIAPIAGSRMTETVLPKDLLDALKPEYVAALVGWLCHEDTEETGGLFEVGGGYYSKLRWERTKGKMFRLGREVTIEDVQASASEFTNFEGATHPGGIAESMQPIMQNVDAGPSKGGNQFIDVDLALGYELPVATTSYDERDLALYALGVGAASNPGKDDKDLQLVYEMYGGGFKALPTYAVIPALNALLAHAKAGVQAPGLNYGLDRLLHGEQYTEIKAPLPTRAKLSHKIRISDIFDKGKNALVVTEVISSDEHGNELIRNEITSLIRGAGGWGGERGPSSDVNTPPERDPDAVVVDKIPENQALLYRLSGDWNPLHADPGMAKAFGFEKPILHGLCTFGYAGRQVVANFAPDGDPRYFKSIRTRFAGTVFPGETLITEMWKESDTKIIFRCKVKARDKVVISNASVELYPEIPKPLAKPKAKAKVGGGPAAKREPNTADMFNAVGGYIAANEGITDKIKVVFQFRLTDPDMIWTIDLKNAPGGVSKGTEPAPMCTLDISDADFLAMATGKADAMKLFSSGKLKISGDIMASQKLGFLKKLTPEMVLAETDKRLGAGGGDDTAAAEAEPTPTSWDVFIAIRDHIERHPEIVAKVKNVFQFKITDPDAVWTVDVRDDKGAVVEGESKKPDCTLEISESDFIDMTTGASDPMKLFTTGKLKISGNIMASQKLDFLQKVDPEQAKAAVIKARAAGQGPGGGAAPAASKGKQASAPAIFAALETRLADKPGLKDEVAAKIQFVVTGPDASWVVDLAGDTPSVASGTADDATATLTIEDGDLADLVAGDQSARELFQHGKLRVDGDLSVAHRLGFLKGLV